MKSSLKDPNYSEHQHDASGLYDSYFDDFFCGDSISTFIATPAFEVAAISGPLDVSNSSSITPEDGQSSSVAPEPLGTNPGPISASEVSWISGTGTNGGTTPTSGGAAANSGFHINLLYDTAAMAAPQSFRTGIQTAMNLLSGAITDNITVNIQIDYSGTGGGAAAGPDGGLYESYSSVRNTLINNAIAGDGTFNALPNSTSIQGQSTVAVWNAQLKLFGLMSPNDTSTDDGSATFATDIDPNLLVGVALHELTHALGRVPYGPQADIFDFYRCTAPGTRLLSGASTAPAAYFSVDGGSTKIADYGLTSDPSDFLNSGVQGANDPFNEFYTSNSLQKLTAVDLRQLDALGFHLASISPTVLQTDTNSYGSTDLAQAGSNYFLYTHGTTTGPELQYKDAPVFAGQFSGWNPTVACKTSSGYDVAWYNSGAASYTVWAIDSNGSYLSNLASSVAGTNTSLQQLEVTFNFDINADGHIGPAATSFSASANAGGIPPMNNLHADGGLAQIISDSVFLGGAPSAQTPLGINNMGTSTDLASWSAVTAVRDAGPHQL